MRAVYLLTLCFLTSSAVVAQTEPTLKLGAKTYTAAELLKRPEIATITVKHDQAYGREMQYQAIRAAVLFAEMNFRDDDVMQFQCLDGFAAFISKERIMGTRPGQSIAYLAIENPKSKWPDLRQNSASGSAGPFYLVWLQPELSGILPEEWPYKVVSFEVKGRLRELYPGIFPRHQEDGGVLRGLKLFQKTCFACHTMNREGASSVGPDLNLPLNPTEYFKASVLPQYIRNPKSVRVWEGSKMPGFGPETFSDQDIADMVTYLKEMAFEKYHKE